MTFSLLEALNFKKEESNEKIDIGMEDINRFSDDKQEVDKDEKKQFIDFVNRDLFLRIDLKDHKHYCFMDDSINTLDNSMCLIVLLNKMKQEDTITIDINCVGGSIVVMGFICSAILRCKGRVITNNLGYAYSAGSMIWACGHEVRLSTGSHFMFHMAITKIEGRSDEKSGELGRAADVTKYMLAFCKDRNVLTQTEYDLIVTQKEDVYITYEEMLSRVAAINQSIPSFKNVIAA